MLFVETVPQPNALLQTTDVCYNDAVKLFFEWDNAKARGNQDKHGLSSTEAATVFNDPLSLLIPDPDHFRR